MVRDRSYQYATVRAARGGDTARISQTVGDEVVGHRMEIVEAVLAFFAQRVLVPARPVFAAPADIGEDIGIAAFDPEQAQRPAAIGLGGEIFGSLRGAEPAIGMDQRGQRALGALGTDEVIGDLGAVLRGGEFLLDGELACVELGGFAGDRPRRALARHGVKRRRGQHALDRDEGGVARAAGLGNLDRAVGREVHRAFGPTGSVRCQLDQLARDIVEHLDPQLVFRSGDLFDRLRFAGPEDREGCGGAAALHVVERPGEQGTRLFGTRRRVQRGIELGDHISVKHRLEFGIDGQRERGGRAILRD